MEPSTVRSLLLLCIALFASACEAQDDSLARYIALDSAVDPVHTVALASQWYEWEYGRWPEQLADVAGLSAELGLALNGRAEPIPIPGQDLFRELQFEAVNDTLLRLHFDLVPFEEEWPEGIQVSGADSVWTYIPPDIVIERSRGVFNIPTYQSLSDFGVRFETAEVLTETGERFVFRDEQLDLPPSIFLRPLEE